ncbi:nucleotide kinase [Salmonella phage SeKF_80]
MRQSAFQLLKASLDNNNGAPVSQVQREVLLNKKVLYRYARPTQQVFGTITAFTGNVQRVWVKWSDGAVESRSIKSLEVIK